MVRASPASRGEGADAKLFFSEWYELKKPIKDRHYDALIDLYKTEEEIRKVLAKKRHKEWFNAPIERIMHFVEHVVSLEI
jgi:ADP-heptose:LPS heptosyltransferase